MMDIALYLLSKKKPDKLDLYKVVLTVGQWASLIQMNSVRLQFLEILPILVV
jgi:hypothetical protein